jgi:hypothetical protein
MLDNGLFCVNVKNSDASAMQLLQEGKLRIDKAADGVAGALPAPDIRLIP